MDAGAPTVADLTTLPVNHFFGKDEVGRIDLVPDDHTVFAAVRNRTIDFLLPMPLLEPVIKAFFPFKQLSIYIYNVKYS